MQHAEKRVGNESISDGVGMNHAPPRRREELDAAKRIVIDELKRHQQTAQQRHGHVAERGEQIPIHQSFDDEPAARQGGGVFDGSQDQRSSSLVP